MSVQREKLIRNAKDEAVVKIVIIIDLRTILSFVLFEPSTSRTFRRKFKLHALFFHLVFSFFSLTMHSNIYRTHDNFRCISRIMNEKPLFILKIIFCLLFFIYFAQNNYYFQRKGKLKAIPEHPAIVIKPKTTKSSKKVSEQPQN